VRYTRHTLESTLDPEVASALAAAPRRAGAASLGARRRDLVNSLVSGYVAVLSGLAHRTSASAALGPWVGAPAALLRAGLQGALLPAVLLLEMVESTAYSVRMFVSSRSLVPRVRVPRFVDPAKPLGRYDWLESYCRLLQASGANGLMHGEAFAGCAQLADGAFAVVTGASIAAFRPANRNEVADGELLLHLPAACVLCVRVDGSQLSIAHEPLEGVPGGRAGARAALGGGAAATSSAMEATTAGRCGWICVVHIHAQDEANAERLGLVLAAQLADAEARRASNSCLMIGF